MKYVVIDGPTGEEMFLFSSTLNHNDVAQRVGGPNPKVLSAGTVLTNDPDVCPLQCVGESTTLRVKSRGEPDNILLRATFQTYC